MNPTQLQASIVGKLGISDLPPEDQSALLIQLGEIMFRGSLVRLVERMDDATRDSFAALMDGNPSELDVQLFLEQNVPDAKDAVASALSDLERDLAEVAAV